MDIKKFLIDNEVGDFKEDESMAIHTSYKVGGKCKFYVLPSNLNKLELLLNELDKNKIRYKVVGNGSNTLFSDDYYDGVIINLSRLNNIDINGTIINVEAGFPLIKLSNICALNSLSGLEFASGIPGNVGGAIYMNAGAYKSDMASVLKEVTFLDENNNVVTLPSDKLEFGYRTSLFKHRKYIILSCVMELKPGNKEEILDLMNDRRERRINSQPLEFPSAGSVFRNPSDDVFAGKLIEDLGLKGYTIGGAKVSEKHANFIINYNNASAKDIKELIEFIKDKVFEKYNISLKIEQEFINFD